MLQIHPDPLNYSEVDATPTFFFSFSTAEDTDSQKVSGCWSASTANKIWSEPTLTSFPNPQSFQGLLSC